MSQHWTVAENAFVKQYSGILTDEKLAVAFENEFGRRMNTEQIRKHRQRLGIKKKKGRGVCAVDL